MASALATPHTATRPSSLSSSFGLFSSLSFMFVLIWLFWLALLGFAFCSAFCSSSIFFRSSALLFALSSVSPLSGMREPVRAACLAEARQHTEAYLNTVVAPMKEGLMVTLRRKGG